MATEETKLFDEVEDPLPHAAPRDHGATKNHSTSRNNHASPNSDPDDPLNVRKSNLLRALQNINDADHLPAQSIFVHKALAIRAVLIKKRFKYQNAYFKNRNRLFILTGILLFCTALTTFVSSISHENTWNEKCVTALGALSTLLTGVIAALKYDSRTDSFQAAANNLNGYIVELNAFVMKHWVRDNGDGQPNDMAANADIRDEYDRLVAKFMEVEIDIRTGTSILPVKKSKWPENDSLF